VTPPEERPAGERAETPASAAESAEAPARAEAPLVVAYDGSEGARRAIEHAGALLGGRPAAVAVVSPPPADVLLPTDLAPAPDLARAAAELDAALAADAEALATEGARFAEQGGLRARPWAVRGDPRVWPTLVDLAEEEGAGAIVVGSRGLSGLRSTVLGSVSHGTLDHSAHPVLVVPPTAGEPGGPAVLCYDGSEPAARAIARAGELLAPRPAVVLAAWSTAAGLASWGTTALPREVVSEACARLDDEGDRRARETAAEGAERARAAGFADVWPLAAPIEANAWATLAGVAAQRGAAVIVTGSRSLSPVRAAVVGSVSRGIAAHASAPVLVVRPPAEGCRRGGRGRCGKAAGALRRGPDAHGGGRS
jgi:nucleotide-binding universal stress UspA family protein